jgi:predicted RNase H-like HicB family nuclease
VSYNVDMQNEYKAVVRQDGRWWIGWVEEIPGVNSQGASREELMENLQWALREMLAQNREEARKAAGGAFEEVRISA